MSASHDLPEFHLSLLGAFAPRNDVDIECPGRKEQYHLSLPFSPIFPWLGRHHTDHMFPLLDALAGICVYQSGQAYAVTMSLSGGQVNLFVAENKQVSQKVIDHLEDIWSTVVGINRAIYPHLLRRDSQTISPSGRSVDLPGTLATKVYAFSLPHLKKRLEKRWSLLQPFLLDNLSTFGQDFVVYFMVLQEALFAELPEFDMIAAAFATTNKYLVSMRFDLDDMRWNRLEREWTGKNQSLVDQWKGTSNREFAPHRCVAKLFSLHKHMLSIRQIACSRRLSAYLRTSKLKITPVAPHTCEDINVTPTSEDIQAVIRENTYPSDSNNREAMITNIMQKLTTSPYEYNGKLNAHCECTLLAYHLAHPEIPHLRYIGASRLLCFACKDFFESYNKHAHSFGQEQYYFKGMRWKLSPGWVFVRFKAGDGSVPQSVVELLERIRVDMIKDIGGWLRRHVREKVATSTIDADSDPDLSQETEALCVESFAKGAAVMA
ncbi:hypothetical protein BOTBODRAFT_62165 [Botryobasidium botryosum FD-172 SS1]|uniref:Uncharacterized protein n=1 Tax=Botryobasidium botryosum (strain FD-172 SS1) TaxID=930990 RepID=A0A067N7I5_BOTB1|nr:hypothetical protein BOTBODRAFT_62165 [Botryobasidium botryosum FD-172 SS1]